MRARARAALPLAGAGITVRAGELTLLRGVDVSLEAGALVGLIGPNGAGKTTLLRVLAGLLHPDAGSVSLGGRPIASIPLRARARTLAYVPQALAMEIDFRALEVALMGRHPYLGRLQPEGPEDVALARAALARMELADRAGSPASTLSAGERQRLQLARSGTQQPAVALCDEPTANLDLRHRTIVFRLLRAFTARGGAALAAVHDLDLAARYCDRLVLLAQGEVVAEGPPAAVITPAHLAGVFGVEAAVTRDPVTGTPRVSVQRASRPGRPGGAAPPPPDGALRSSGRHGNVRH